MLTALGTDHGKPTKAYKEAACNLNHRKVGQWKNPSYMTHSKAGLQACPRQHPNSTCVIRYLPASSFDQTFSMKQSSY